MTPDSSNISLLIQQLQSGDQKAFTALYDLFASQLYRNIFRLVKDEDIAQELLQDLFTTVWEKRVQIDPEKSFKSYLYKVAENLAYSHFRKIAKSKRLIDQLIVNTAEFEKNAEEIIIGRESQELLKKAIESLSPQRKLIYTLCKMEGKSYQEVGEQLGISGSTVSDHIVKANKTLKQFFIDNREFAGIVLITAISGMLER